MGLNQQHGTKSRHRAANDAKLALEGPLLHIKPCSQRNLLKRQSGAAECCSSHNQRPGLLWRPYKQLIAPQQHSRTVWYTERLWQWSQATSIRLKRNSAGTRCKGCSVTGSRVGECKPSRILDSKPFFYIINGLSVQLRIHALHIPTASCLPHAL